MRIVATPEFIGRCLTEPGCAQVLAHWRDGRLRLVLNRELLVIHCRVLRSLGLSEEQLKCWIWWFTSPEKSEFHESIPTGETAGAAICASLAKNLSIPVLCSEAWSETEGWISPGKMEASLSGQRQRQ